MTFSGQESGSSQDHSDIRTSLASQSIGYTSTSAPRLSAGCNAFHDPCPFTSTPGSDPIIAGAKVPPMLTSNDASIDDASEEEASIMLPIGSRFCFCQIPARHVNAFFGGRVRMNGGAAPCR